MSRTEIIERFGRTHDNMIGILHELQDNNPGNDLTEEDMKEVAKYLNTSYSHVYGVATYYSMFSVRPRGKHIVRVCNSPLCDMMESGNAIKRVAEYLKIEPGATTADNLFTLELSECLGVCDMAPAMMIGKDVYGNLDKADLDSIFKKYK